MGVGDDHNRSGMNCNVGAFFSPCLTTLRGFRAIWWMDSFGVALQRIMSTNISDRTLIAALAVLHLFICWRGFFQSVSPHSNGNVASVRNLM